MKEEEEPDLLKQLAKEIANNKNKWFIIKEINDMIETSYDKFHFMGILAKYGILKPEYFEIIKNLEDKSLLLILRKYIREIVFSEN